ncbi:transposase [Streptomyces sp. NPDC006365]|uniref:transposase n=1 Tax=Streptomyces sp. NPDC006365 TaxID=3364744 RepID=UPI0036D01065
MGPITGARMLHEFRDARPRYASAKTRKNYPGTSPITRDSGKSRTVQASLTGRHLLPRLGRSVP